MGRYFEPVAAKVLGLAAPADKVAELSTPKPAPLERRAALDIGSGCTKMLVADVDPSTGRCVQVLLTCEVPVLFGVALRRAADGRLSEEVQAQGLEELGRLVREAEALCPKRVAAVATEAFRRAPNGDFVSRVKQEVGLDVRIIDQGIEARLGFCTAAAVSTVPAAELIAWDCGGASYQLVTAEPNMPVGTYRTHCGSLGDAVATAALVELQGRSFAEVPSPNPVSLAEAEALVVRLQERMPDVPAWLRGARGVVAIGGRNSMFALLADMLRAGGEEPGREGEEAELPTACTVTRAEAWAAVRANVGHSDADLERLWCWRPNSDPPSMVLPKLCLIIASLTKFELESAQWRRTVGCCPGVLVADVLPA